MDQPAGGDAGEHRHDVAVPLSVPLSVAMRAGSALEHAQAEGSGFVADLLEGRAAPERYAAYLLRLRVVYAALEGAIGDLRHDPFVAEVHDEELHRLEGLERDLDHWSPGAGATVRSPAADAYRERIERARRRPALLVAHHYTRYLGDLSGGRMLAQALRRGYVGRGLERHGLAFYDFPGIAKPVTYKRAYRARLDALPLTEEVRDEVVDEVRCAFRLNHALLEEVAGLRVGAALTRPR